MKASLVLFIVLCAGCINETVVLPSYEVHYPQGQKSSHGLVNEININTLNNQSIIKISSHSGIGRVVIKLNQGHWPEMILVHLYLKGLEGFNVSNENITIDKTEMLVSAYGENNRLYDRKYLLNEGGYYKIMLPNKLFTDKTTEITLQWVDFYR